MSASRRFAFWIAVAGLLAALGGAPRMFAANQILSESLSVSPSTAIDGTEVTYTAKIAPTSGPMSELWLDMESTHWFQISGPGGVFTPAGGTCEPVDVCTVDSRTGNPRWHFVTLTAPVTLKFHTLASSGDTTHLGVLSDGVGCTGECPARATIAVPSVKAKVTYVADSQPIVAGTVLHVTVTGTATAGPMDGVLNAGFSAGLAAPTNVSSGATCAVPPGTCTTDALSINKTAKLTFDIVVTAKNGESVSITGKYFPSDHKYPTTPHKLTIKVGPQAPTAGPSTPRPRASARAPSPSPTAVPSPTVLPSPSVASTPTGGPTAAASEAEPTQPETTASPAALAGSSDSASPQSAAAQTVDVGAVGFVILGLGGGAVLIWAISTRPGLLRRRPKG